MLRSIFFCILALIFGVTPIVFSWLYIPWIEGAFFDPMIQFLSWIVYPTMNTIGFESVKVLFVIVTVCLSLCFFLAAFHNNISLLFSEKFLLSVILFLIWYVCFVSLRSDIIDLGYFFTWSPEKRHGLYLYLSLWILFFLVQTLQYSYIKKLLYSFSIGFFCVLLFAVFQQWDLDPNNYNSRLQSSRIFSTLGNPNYLAWLILMMLPFLSAWKLKKYAEYNLVFQIFLLCLSGYFLYFTGSYLAWWIFLLYLLYVSVRFVVHDRNIRMRIGAWVAVFLLMSIWIVFVLYGDIILKEQKMMGFIARWFLWHTGILAIFDTVYSALLWYGPDGFFLVSESFRHPLLSVYEDPAYRIDRSHNFFIDLMLQFWLPLSVYFLYLAWKKYWSLSHAAKMSVVLFVVYFSFNIPVVVHYLLLILIFAGVNRRDGNKGVYE